jgi:hypothetical protein
MTSQINPNNIDGTYPVAGQDNDSQGFRDNFTNIRNNFTFTKAELEDLQNKVVLKSPLLNTSLNNDFLGNAIVNPRLTSWRETYFNAGLQSGAYTVDFTRGNFQKVTLNGSLILNFSFPSNTQDQYASVKLWISNPSASYILSFPNTMTLGTPSTVSGFSGNSITFSTSDISTTTDYFFEVFTFNGGTTYGIRDLTRNRDFSGNSITFTGSFTANGVVTLGSGSSNVVVAATTASPAASTTVGALVVAGGATIAGNLNVGANLVTTGGRINQNYAIITLTDNQNYFANIDHQTQIFDTASSATIANARIALPSAAIDGREINMSFLAPITALWVNSGNTALVRWMPNNTVSSGNVHVQFIYSSGLGTWVRTE